ncbi:formimidoylglutamase [Shewanella cyperi]|uniref:formimidoylglutamase n=1 Tax=Shewanella cyperi TaxID=2814292 RepID=UPI001A946AD5|nr:formimidoylglutamase [Shewanella cyperi]QSX40498.1 formimidoylglutamase [Shewanella cyperi]
MRHLITFSQDLLKQLLGKRPGESRLGDNLLLPQGDTLEAIVAQAKADGARFAILGIAEDLGPRANLGRGGSTNALEACLKWFVNLQANRFYDGKDCLLLGTLDCSDLHQGELDTETLRNRVAEVDDRVIALCTVLMEAEIEPIVIGGGHNNAYGMLMATRAAYGRPVAAVNLDPHSDFRPREGRHSGNGFSYAAASGALDHYHVLGLHELKNSEANLEQLTAFGGSWHSLQDIWVRREITLEEALRQIAKDLRATSLPVALELDLDAISNMPSSACTAAGVPLLDACHYVSYIAGHSPCAYLHLAEAAPVCHEAGLAAGMREVGQSLTELIYAYIQGRRSFCPV